MNLVENIYDLRQNFMILGVTGRTGSGCTTVANLLNGGFDCISTIPSTSNNGMTNDERKYKIEYNFLKKIWNKKNFEFTIIKASDVIFLYALKEDFLVFRDFLFKQSEKYITIRTNGIVGRGSADISAEKKIMENQIDTLKEKFKKYRDFALKFDDYIENQIYKCSSVKSVNKKKETDDETEISIEECLHFFNVELPNFRKEVMGISGKSKGEITSLFQTWGNNVRKYGKITEEGQEAENPSRLAHTINRIIKLIRYINRPNDSNQNGKPTFIIIDSLRNPYEVLYFRERYSAFYLMSISTNDFKRRNNLYRENFRANEIDDMDEREYPSQRSKDIGFSYYSQNVERCVELSDIHIIHNNDKVESNVDLKKQIMHIIALILHPGLVQPTHEERLMQIAYTAKFNSGCLSRQVGAVVTDKNFSVKSIGWNTVAKGQTPCTLRNLCDLKNRSDLSAFSEFEKSDTDFRKTTEEIWNEYHKTNRAKGDRNTCHSIEKLNGLPLAFCFKDYYRVLNLGNKDQTYTRSLHAEENAFLQLTKYGTTGIDGGYLFTTASCCELCAKKAYQLGISKIIYIDVYPGISTTHILHAGDREIELVQFRGIIGRAYEALYSPFFPMKDEIEYLTKVEIKYPLGSIGKHVDIYNSGLTTSSEMPHGKERKEGWNNMKQKIKNILKQLKKRRIWLFM